MMFCEDAEGTGWVARVFHVTAIQVKRGGSGMNEVHRRVLDKGNQAITFLTRLPTVVALFVLPDGTSHILKQNWCMLDVGPRAEQPDDDHSPHTSGRPDSI